MDLNGLSSAVALFFCWIVSATHLCVCTSALLATDRVYLQECKLKTPKICSHDHCSAPETQQNVESYQMLDQKAVSAELNQKAASSRACYTWN